MCNMSFGPSLLHYYRHILFSDANCSEPNIAMSCDSDELECRKYEKSVTAMEKANTQPVLFCWIDALKSFINRPEPWIVTVGILALLTSSTAIIARSYRMEPDISVAFIGNSITFVNDLPRLMETISNNHITQNSCLHGGARFKSIIRTGNGMAQRWITPQSMIQRYFLGFDVYDFGACSVRQLLLGYDSNLTEFDQNGAYVDDGKNPCFNTPVYLQYLHEKFLENPYPPHWDYIVLNDQTRSPAHTSKRKQSLQALKRDFLPYFIQTGARPVFLMTHGYWSNNTNMTGLGGSVPSFTSRVYYGYQEYASLLKDLLPQSQEPLIAPAGLAFLLLWEENRNMWEKLIYVDGFHPTPHGTFLIANVLYATLYGKMPGLDRIPRSNVSLLWQNARKMQIDTHFNVTMPIPTRSEALYLRWIAERVTLKGYRPKSLIHYYEEENGIIKETGG